MQIYHILAHSPLRLGCHLDLSVCYSSLLFSYVSSSLFKPDMIDYMQPATPTMLYSPTMGQCPDRRSSQLLTPVSHFPSRMLPPPGTTPRILPGASPSGQQLLVSTSYYSLVFLCNSNAPHRPALELKYEGLTCAQGSGCLGQPE